MSTTNPDPSHPAPGNPPEHGGAVDPAAVRRGYEADGYDSKSVLAVPVLVIVFFVLAFTATTALFAYFSHAAPNPMAHPAAIAQNSEPLNKRLDRIHRGGEVDQPRLEPLRLREGESRVITRPETKEGNSPLLHAEDIRASNTPALQQSGWIDGGKTVAHVTIDEAMKIALKPDSKTFPTAKPGSRPDESFHVPTEANAGRGAAGATAVPPPLPKVEVKK